MKSIGRLLLLGAALALLAPTSSWADHTDTGSRHGTRRHDRTHSRVDHRRNRPQHRPSLSFGYSHHGGAYVRFDNGYSHGQRNGPRDGHRHRHYRRARNLHDSYYSRSRHYHRGYDNPCYDGHDHRGHH